MNATRLTPSSLPRWFQKSRAHEGLLPESGPKKMQAGERCIQSQMRWGIRPKLTRLDKPHSVVALEENKAKPRSKALPRPEIGIARKKVARESGGALDQGSGLRPLGKPEARVAALARPQNFAAAPQAEILLRDDEAVVHPAQCVEPGLRRFGKRASIKKNARGLG